MAASCTRGTSNSHDVSQDVAQYEAIIRVMEEEKDYYKKEYEALKAARRSAGPIKVMPNKVNKNLLSLAFLSFGLIHAGRRVLSLMLL